MEKIFVAQFNEGYCYKNLDNFLNKHDEICYIAECAFDDGDMVIRANDEQITEMIADGSATTTNEIIKQLHELCKSYKVPENRLFIEWLARCVFDVCEWQCISTYLNVLSIDEVYADWCNERKAEFELYAVMNVRDELSGELYDEMHHNELFEQLYSFLGEDCYLYHNPEDLIDRWESEPCY